MNISPEYYGLGRRVKLEQVSENNIAIVKLIKSRIIQKGAQKIIDMSLKIQEKEPEFNVSLICNDNICSKSKFLLNDNNIDIIIHSVE